MVILAIVFLIVGAMMAKFMMYWWVILVTAILLSAALGQEIWEDKSPETGEENGSKDPVSRANYGVLLKPIKTIYPAMSIWMHVFAMPIPKMVSLDQFFNQSACKSKPGAIIRAGERQVLDRNVVEEKICQGKYCQRNGTRVENEQQTNNTMQDISVYKCIILKKVMSRLDNLKRAVLVRLWEMRQSALRLVRTNSTSQAH